MVEKVDIGVRVKLDEKTHAEIEALLVQFSQQYKKLDLHHHRETAEKFKEFAESFTENIKDVAKEVMSPFGVTLGLTVGALALTAYGIASVSREFATQAVKIEGLSKELDLDTRTIEGFKFAGGEAGVTPEEAMGGLTHFAKVSDEIRSGLGSTILRLRGMTGDRELLDSIQKSKSNSDALLILMERVDELRQKHPLQARLLVEQFLGNFHLIGMTAEDVRKFSEMVQPLTEEGREVTKAYLEALNDLDGAFFELKLQLNLAALPGLQRALDVLSETYKKNPKMFDPISDGFKQIGHLIGRLNRRDMVKSGKGLGIIIKGAVAVIKGATWLLSRTPSDVWQAMGSTAGAVPTPWHSLWIAADKSAELFKQFNAEMDKLSPAIIGGAPGAVGSAVGSIMRGGGGAMSLKVPPMPMAVPLAPGSTNLPGFPGGVSPRTGGDAPTPWQQRQGGGGNVDPKALYNSYVEKFKNSKLNGYVPKDGDKWGIKTGDPREWARLALATSQQESSLNANAPGGGLNQFGPRDLARYGLDPNKVNDADTQSQALVNQFEKFVRRDEVIAGASKDGSNQGYGGATAYFGSIRTGAIRKYMDWANRVGESTDEKVNAPAAVPRPDPSMRSLIDQLKQVNPPDGRKLDARDRDPGRAFDSYHREQQDVEEPRVSVRVKAHAPRGYKIDVGQSQNNVIDTLTQQRSYPRNDPAPPPRRQAAE